MQCTYDMIWDSELQLDRLGIMLLNHTLESLYGCFAERQQH